MAFIVSLSLIPKYCPDIAFPRGCPALHYQSRRVARCFQQSEIQPEATYRSKGKTIPDFVAINGYVSMSAEAKELIETFEPGIHQFLPVNVIREHGTKPIYRLNGNELEGPYYLLNTQTLIDAVDIEKSEVYVQVISPSAPLVVHQSDRSRRIVLKKSVISGYHVWRGRYQMSNNLFFSDELKNAVETSKFRKLEFSHVIEE